MRKSGNKIDLSADLLGKVSKSYPLPTAAVSDMTPPTPVVPDEESAAAPAKAAVRDSSSAQPKAAVQSTGAENPRFKRRLKVLGELDISHYDISNSEPSELSEPSEPKQPKPKQNKADPKPSLEPSIEPLVINHHPGSA